MAFTTTETQLDISDQVDVASGQEFSVTVWARNMAGRDWADIRINPAPTTTTTALAEPGVPTNVTISGSVISWEAAASGGTADTYEVKAVFIRSSGPLTLILNPPIHVPKTNPDQAISGIPPLTGSCSSSQDRTILTNSYRRRSGGISTISPCPVGPPHRWIQAYSGSLNAHIRCLKLDGYLRPRLHSTDPGKKLSREVGLDRPSILHGTRSLNPLQSKRPRFPGVEKRGRVPDDKKRERRPELR